MKSFKGLFNDYRITYPDHVRKKIEPVLIWDVHAEMEMIVRGVLLPLDRGVEHMTVMADYIQ